MPASRTTPIDKRRFAKSFLIELVVYSVIVVFYFFLVLHFLGGWLKHLFDTDKRLYAVVALGLMLSQGVMLEITTSALLRFIRARTS